MARIGSKHRLDNMVYYLLFNKTSSYKITMNTKTQKVPYEGMKAIHDIACTDWKAKIKKMTKVFADTELTEDQVEEMFNAASPEQAKTLKEWLKHPGLVDKQTIQEKLDSLTLPYQNKNLTKQQKSVNSLVQLFVIAECFNGGKELSWKDTETSKYFPYKYYSGGSWSVDWYCYYDSADFVSGVCYKDSKSALAAYEMFPEIFDDYTMFNA